MHSYDRTNETIFVCCGGSRRYIGWLKQKFAKHWFSVDTELVNVNWARAAIVIIKQFTAPVFADRHTHAKIQGINNRSFQRSTV